MGSPNFRALTYVRPPASCAGGALEEYLPKLRPRSPRVTEAGGLTYICVGRLGRTSSESNLIECGGLWSAGQASTQLGPASEEQPSEARYAPLRVQTYLVIAKKLIHMYHTIFFLAAVFMLGSFASKGVIRM